MKILKKTLFYLLIVLVIAQFFGPEKNQDDLTSVNVFLEETTPSTTVLKVLETSCFDCHTNKTNYPWYNKITPVNYWLASHVNDGKKHLNFSEWGTYSLKRKEHKMDELYEEVAEGEMPLKSYTWTHTEANLTQDQIAAVVAWGKNVQADYKQKIAGK